MEVYLKYSGYKEIDTYKLLYGKTISHVRIYSENPTLLENGVFYRVDDYIREKSWYELAYKLDGLFTWDLIYEERDLYPKPYLSLVRLLKNQYSERFGVLVINLNPAEINNILKTINFKTFLIDKHRRIIAGNGEDYIGEELDISFRKLKKRRIRCRYRGRKIPDYWCAFDVAGGEGRLLSCKYNSPGYYFERAS